MVHLERNERHDARDRLKRADAVLRVQPEKLVAATACLVVARYRLAEGRAKTASEMIARARHGWSPPSWLDHTLTLLESRAYAVAGDLSSAVGVAERANPGASLDATVALAHGWLDAGDDQAAGQALENGPDDAGEVEDPNRLDRWLATRGSATAAATRLAADDLCSGPCSWVNPNNSGCHSPCRRPGSVRYYGATHSLPTPTGTCLSQASSATAGLSHSLPNKRHR